MKEDLLAAISSFQAAPDHLKDTANRRSELSPKQHVEEKDSTDTGEQNMNNEERTYRAAPQPEAQPNAAGPARAAGEPFGSPCALQFRPTNQQTSHCSAEIVQGAWHAQSTVNAEPDFAELARQYPDLREHVHIGRSGRGSIDFTNFEAAR